MNRRGFLNRMFGAAVVATMPKIVVEQIEALPEFNQKKVDVEHLTMSLPSNYVSQALLFIYNDKKLVGISKEITLNMSRPIHEVRGGEWNEELGIWVPNMWNEYIPGPMQWFLHANHVEWTDDVDFESNIKYNCLIAYQDIKIKGEMYWTEAGLRSSKSRSYKYACTFVGSGELIVTNNEIKI